MDRCFLLHYSGNPTEDIAGLVPETREGAEQAAREALKRDALSWGLPEREIDHVLQHHTIEVARNLLWQGREPRRRAPSLPIVATG